MYWVGYLLGYIINGIIFGLITRYVANSKGYDGGFWWGFFLGLIGLLVVGFRPNIIAQTESPSYVSSNQRSVFSDRNINSSENSRNTKWRCECGALNPNSVDYCLACRKKKRDFSYLSRVSCPYCGAQNKAYNNKCFACGKSLEGEDEKTIPVTVPTPIEETNESQSSKNQVSNRNIEILQQLAQLHEQGILTDDEFNQKKMQILSKI